MNMGWGLVTFTVATTGQPILVNPDQIQCVYEGPGKTLISFGPREEGEIGVRESLADVKRIINREP